MRLAASIQNPLVYGKSLGFGCYGLLENGIRVKKGNEMQKFPIQAVLADDIIGVEGGKNLEQLSQARKKDHVFEITNTAIERVPVVETPLFSDLDQYELLDYPEDEARQEAAAKEFLKKTRKVGIWYGTSK